MTRTVAELMTHDVVTVTPDTTFRDAVRLLEDRRVDTLPVVTDDRKVVGVLTASDLLLKEEISEGPRGVPGLPWQRRRDRVRGAGTDRAPVHEHRRWSPSTRTPRSAPRRAPCTATTSAACPSSTGTGA